MAFSFDKSLLNPKSLATLGELLQKVFRDLEDSLSTTPAIQPDLGQGPPRAAVGDLIINQVNGNITFKFVVADNETVNITLGPSTTDLNSNYLGVTTTAALPTTVEYPAENNWGFHHNTATSKIYLVFNLTGSIKKVELT